MVLITSSAGEVPRLRLGCVCQIELVHDLHRGTHDLVGFGGAIVDLKGLFRGWCRASIGRLLG